VDQSKNLRSAFGTKSSWTFNCNRVTRRLKRSDPAAPCLFASDALNYIVLTKEVLTRDDPRRADASPIGTKLYLPFEAEAPEKGGRSVLIHHPKLTAFLAETAGLTIGGNEDAFESDMRILHTIDELPSLDEFLLRDALSLQGITPNETYFEVTPEERGAIQRFIRDKMEMLVRAAFGGAKPDQAKVTQLIDTVWEAKDLMALDPLIAALRCPRAEALTIFAAWKGIMFYSFDYFRTEEKRKSLAMWLNKSVKPNSGLPKDYTQYLRERIQGIVQRLRHHWLGVDTLLKDYNRLYDDFVTSMEPGGFIDFLRNAKQDSYSVGISLGKISQAVGCLEMMPKSSPDGGVSATNFDTLLGQLTAALAPAAKAKQLAA
jgi:hypothetical protein